MCLTNIKCLKNLVVVKQASKDRLMSGKQCQSFSPGLKGRERVGRNDTKCAVQNMEGSGRFFPGPLRRRGDLSPKSIMGGPLRGDTDIMGDLTLINYIIH